MDKSAVRLAILHLWLLCPLVSYAQDDPYNCALIVPNAQVSKETDEQAQAGAKTLFKIAQADVLAQKKVTTVTKNLQNNVPESEKLNAQIRLIYLFCQMLSKEKIAPEKKIELVTNLADKILSTTPQPGSLPQKPASGTTGTGASVSPHVAEKRASEDREKAARKLEIAQAIEKARAEGAASAATAAREADAAKYFEWTFCNKSARDVSVATVKRISPDATDYLTIGWYKVAPSGCITLTKLPRGYFYWYAEGLDQAGKLQKWSGVSEKDRLGACVERPGPFRRLTGNGVCNSPSTVEYFRGGNNQESSASESVTD